MFLMPVTSELSGFHGWIDNRDSKGEVGIEIIGCGGCQMDVKKEKQPGTGTEGPMNKQPGVGPTAGGQV